MPNGGTAQHDACIKGGFCFLATLSDDAQAMTLISDPTLEHWRDETRRIAGELDLQASCCDVWMAPALGKLATQLRSLSHEMGKELAT